MAAARPAKKTAKQRLRKALSGGKKLKAGLRARQRLKTPTEYKFARSR